MSGGERLHRVLGPLALTSLGVGATIGTGIYVLTGEVARMDAGPSLMLSFLLFSGVNIPVATLPAWMQVISNLLPFTHGLEAVRQAAAGAGLDRVGGLIAIEAGIGVAYAVAAFALFSYLERSARANATLDVR